MLSFYPETALLLGTPIAIAIAVPSFLVIWAADLGTAVIAPNFFAGIAKFPLLAIPLFILAGFILERCGISQRIIHFANLLVGRRRGGLAIVAIGVCVFLAVSLVPDQQIQPLLEPS